MALARARSLSNIAAKRIIGVSSINSRDYASGSSGEPLRKDYPFQQYTDEFVKRGRQNPINWKEYKNHEYLNWNQWSYYDLEVELTKHRLPQPNPKVPEKPLDTVPPAPQPEKK